MPSLKRIIEGSDTKLGRTFDFAVLILIVLSLIAFSLETLPNLSTELRAWLQAFEVFTVVAFSLEYCLRVLVATPKRSYVLSFFGLIDLLAIFPSILGLGIDLRTVKSLRLLRLFRILKLARYSAAARRFHRAILIAKEEVVLFMGAALILLYLAAVGIYQFESEAQPDAFGSVFHCLWWAVATLTTVGYGDVYPVTVGGKIFTFIILVIGLGVISVPAGLVASALGQARKMEDDSADPLATEENA